MTLRPHILAELTLRPLRVVEIHALLLVRPGLRWWERLYVRVSGAEALCGDLYRMEMDGLVEAFYVAGEREGWPARIAYRVRRGH